MNIWEIDKLVLFIAFVIPGFITLKVYELLNPSQVKDSSKQVIDAITYSSINYVFLLLPIYIIEISDLKTKCSVLYVLAYSLSLFVFPILIAMIWNWIRERDFVQKKIPHPTQKPWDWVFSQKKSYWIKVVMKNGDVIAGAYAESSFASSAPAEEQIYLEETWLLNSDGGFERLKESSAGVIILASEISSLELLKYGE